MTKKIEEVGTITVPVGSWEAWATIPPVMTLRFDRFEDIDDFSDKADKGEGDCHRTDTRAAHKSSK